MNGDRNVLKHIKLLHDDGNNIMCAVFDEQCKIYDEARVDERQNQCLV